LSFVEEESASRAVWLWLGFLGLAILALTAAVVFAIVFLEPGYQAFRREIAREMQYVEPLPAGLTIVEDWEECGQGEDPLCSGVVLLVDDDWSVEPPVDRVRVALMSKGWHETEGDSAVLQRTRRAASGARVQVRRLIDVIDEPSTSLALDHFVSGHPPEDIAYIYVAL
jgi:hypothetical protein